MTPREMVLAALSHSEPDQLPFDLSATVVSGIHVRAYRRLREALGLPKREPQIWHLSQQLAWVDDDVHEAMGTCAKGGRAAPPAGWQLVTREDDRYVYYTDEWGIERRKQKENGHYFDICACPLAAAESVQEIERYRFPDPVDPARFTGLLQLAERVRAGGRAFVLGSISGGMLEMGLWLKGFEGFYCDLAMNRSLVEALCDKILELKTSYWNKVLAEFGELVDVVHEGDDYGGQHGLLLSPQMWRALFKPRLRQLFDSIKRAAPHVRIFFHSCGSIVEIIPDLIEVGMYILNPIQVAAAGMDTAELKRRFGRELCFWGGGVDTQRVLPRGTPEEVRAEVKRRIDDLAPGGGFVFNTVHNIQADVPPENIIAMREAVELYGRK